MYMLFCKDIKRLVSQQTFSVQNPYLSFLASTNELFFAMLTSNETSKVASKSLEAVSMCTREPIGACTKKTIWSLCNRIGMSCYSNCPMYKQEAQSGKVYHSITKLTETSYRLTQPHPLSLYWHQYVCNFSEPVGKNQALTVIRLFFHPIYGSRKVISTHRLPNHVKLDLSAEKNSILNEEEIYTTRRESSMARCKGWDLFFWFVCWSRLLCTLYMGISPTSHVCLAATWVASPANFFLFFSEPNWDHFLLTHVWALIWAFFGF